MEIDLRKRDDEDTAAKKAIDNADDSYDLKRWMIAPVHIGNI